MNSTSTPGHHCATPNCKCRDRHSSCRACKPLFRRHRRGPNATRLRQPVPERASRCCWDNKRAICRKRDTWYFQRKRGLGMRCNETFSLVIPTWGYSVIVTLTPAYGEPSPSASIHSQFEIFTVREIFFKRRCREHQPSRGCQCDLTSRHAERLHLADSNLFRSTY